MVRVRRSANSTASNFFRKGTDSVGKAGVGNDFFAIGGHVALDNDRGSVVAGMLPPLIQVDGSSSEASTIPWLLDIDPLPTGG
jgi:hypothetical protein